LELYREILNQAIKSELAASDFSKLKEYSDTAVEMICYETLKKIKVILEDDNLNDKECFIKIEEIICLFEDIGSGCGERHDFG